MRLEETIQAAPTVRPNRTVPEAEAPKTGVRFSANPTAQELLRTRVFEKENFCKDGTHRWMRSAGRDADHLSVEKGFFHSFAFAHDLQAFLTSKFVEG